MPRRRSGVSVHDVVEQVIAEVEGRDVPGTDYESEKVAQAQTPEPLSEERVQTLLKYADALEGLAHGLGANPALGARFAKAAASGSTPPDRRGTGTAELMQGLRGAKSKSTPSSPEVDSGNWQPPGQLQFGGAKKQIQDKALQGNVSPGGGATHMAMEEVSSGGAPPDLQKKEGAAERERLIHHVLSKLGAFDGNEVGPTITQSGFPKPMLPQYAGGEGPGSGAQGADLISSVDRAINFTKREGKRIQVAQLAKFLSERAHSKATDPVLHSGFENADKAGVKIASPNQRSVRDVFAAIAVERR